MSLSKSIILDAKLFLADVTRRNIFSQRVGYNTGLFNQDVLTLPTNMSAAQSLPVLTNNSNTFLWTSGPTQISLSLANQVTANGGTITITGGSLSCTGVTVTTAVTLPPVVNNTITLSNVAYTVSNGVSTSSSASTSTFTGCLTAPPSTASATGAASITAPSYSVSGTGTTVLTGGAVSSQGANTLVTNCTLTTSGTITVVITGGSVVVASSSTNYSASTNGMLILPFPVTAIALQNSSLANTVDVVLIQD